MKANQLATLALRLTGIYCLVLLAPMAELFNNVLFYAQNSASGIGTALVITTALITISWLGIGILLIVFSKSLGEKLTPRSNTDGNITTISFEQVQILAFAVAGVLIFAEELPQLPITFFSFLHYLAQLREKNPYPDTGWPFNRFGYLTAVGNLLKAALGLWLFFGAHGFANFWRSTRNFATPKPPEN